MSIDPQDFWEVSSRRELWIKCEKESLQAFERSVADVLAPLPVVESHFSFASIRGLLLQVTNQPPSFSGLPAPDYDFLIEVSLSDLSDVWRWLLPDFTNHLANRISVKFESTFLETEEGLGFVQHSGTNRPTIFNLLCPDASHRYGHSPRAQGLSVPAHDL